MSNETPNVPPGYENELRSKSKAELAQQASGWKTGTAPHWLCLWEIERRRNLWPEVRSWAAFVISLIALSISITRT